MGAPSDHWIFRRSARGLFACGALLLFSAPLTVPSSASVKTVTTGIRTCPELKRWAQIYRDASPTLEQLAEWDRPHRVAIFNAIRPKVRSMLWQDQLRRFGQREDLSSIQRELVIEGAALMTPALYDHDPAATRAFQSFWTRATGAFETLEFKRAWFDVGSVVTVGASDASSSTSTHLFDRSTRSAQTVSCDCNGYFQDCPPGSFGCGGANCVQSIGCGPGAVYPCNGVCQ